MAPYEWAWDALRRLPEGIEPHEVLQVLAAAVRRPVPAVSQGLQLLTIWGRTETGRALIVICRHRGGLDYDIERAREMSPEELTQFTKWEEARNDTTD